MHYYFWAFGFALIWVLRSLVVTGMVFVRFSCWANCFAGQFGLVLFNSVAWICLLAFDLGVAGELCFCFDLCVMVGRSDVAGVVWVLWVTCGLLLTLVDACGCLVVFFACVGLVGFLGLLWCFAYGFWFGFPGWLLCW